MIVTKEMSRRALFCDETSEFRIPMEPKPWDVVRFRFRTGAGCADRVYIIDKKRGKNIPMERVVSTELFDYYEVRLRMTTERFTYVFCAEQNGEKLYYQKTGVVDMINWDAAFAVIPGFSTPVWAKGAVMYQIFVDRFYNGDETNDVRNGEYIYVNGLPVRKIQDWDSKPTSLDVNNFYGGDLQGVLDKLDYLEGLGVEVIYFNPLFVSPSNHKYDIQDYDHIDPHYGKIVKDDETVIASGMLNQSAKGYITRVTDPENLEASNEFFAHLVEEIHKRGMRVILDGVFNHCGSFNKWMDAERIYEGQEGYDAGAFIEKESRYHDFFKFHGEGWPYNDNFDGWWGYKTLPKLNYENSQELCDYILEIGRKWVSPPYNCDGWRLDVAADLGYSPEFNHNFWKQFRKVVKEANPDAIILAEHYGSPLAWLQGDEWDTVMNYDAFMEPLTFFLTGMEKHSDSYYPEKVGDGRLFFDTMWREMSKYHIPSLQVAMNELSNHDHSRFLTRTNHIVGRTATHGAETADEKVNKSVLRQAVMVQMTWPGAPTIYYGDEAGVCGWTDPDSRRTYPWGKEDLELIEYHKYMTRIHRRNPGLRIGSIKELIAEKDLICYGRVYHANRLVVAVNTAKKDKKVKIPVWELGIDPDASMLRLMTTGSDTYNSGRLLVDAEDGYLEVTVPADGSVLYAVAEDSIHCAGEDHNLTIKTRKG